MTGDSRIAFGGHFALGELCSAAQSGTMARAQAEDAVVAVLVDDVGVRQNTARFVRGGRPLLEADYKDRWRCAETSCLRAYLHPPDEVEQVIDVAQYERIVELLEEQSPKALEYLSKTDVDLLPKANKALYEELSMTFRDVIVPDLVARRLCEYGLTMPVHLYANARKVRPGSVNVYSEQRLINTVTKRTRGREETSRGSWRALGEHVIVDERSVYINIEQVVSERGSPLCRGIMLALYQEVALAGFREIVEHYAQNAKSSLDLTHNLYDYIHRYFPEQPDWQLTFRTHYYDHNGEPVRE
jgi:hypothetical protein